jgi:predicted DNA-binding protein
MGKIKKKDKTILIKCNGNVKEKFKKYACETGRGMSEIIMEHIEADINGYERNIDKKKKSNVSSKVKEQTQREMSNLYYMTNILNILKEKGIKDEDIEKEVKAFWDTVI